MKKIYNRFGGFSKLRIALLLGFIAMGLTAWSQVTPNGKKNAAKSNVSIPIEMNLSQTSNDSRVNQTVKSVDKGITTAKNTKMQKAPMRANTYLTVCEGTQTNAYLPLRGYNYDDRYQINQMIYPSSLLTNLVGKDITSLTFYANLGITLSAGQFEIRLGTTTDQTTFSSPITRITSGMTLVATKSMSNCISGQQIVIEFDTPFTYEGGNLVVDFHLTTRGSSYQSLNFYGISQSNASFYSLGRNTTTNSYGVYNADQQVQSFLPQVSFGYATTEPIIDVTPDIVNFEVEPGTTETEIVSVSGLNLSENITITLNDANGVFTLNTNSLNSSGGNLEVTYSPSEPGTHTATITLSSTGVTQNITLNGTCKIKTDATICDGTATDEHLPVYGWYYDASQHNQMLYPADKFTNSGMNGKAITKITFYPTTSGSYSGINFYDDNSGEATVTIKLANMPSGTAGYAASTSLKSADFVEVKTITMPSSSQSITEWVFENLEDSFVYEGGDLLIDVTTDIGYAGHTYFACENQGTGNYASCYSYTGAYNKEPTGLTYLPKVKFDFEETTPVTSGTIEPTELDFGGKGINNSYELTVTVTNTGNQNFTPEVNTSGLPSVFSVSGPGEVRPHQTGTIVVTFTPTEETFYSGSFTVTIPIPDGDDLEFTVTVTGSGYDANKLTSNMVEIPVYKSDVNPNGSNGYPYIFSQNDVENDIDMSLSYDDVSDGVSILVKSDEQITGYDLKHKPANGNTWSTAGTATHQGNSYVAGETTMSFGQDETEMWFPMDDQQEEAYDYVPVTVANSIVAGGTQGNTYGAPIRTKNVDNVTLEVIVGGSKSDQRPYGSWVTDGVDYCVYTPVIMISSEALNGDTHIPYMFRAWLLSDDVIYDFERNTTNGHIVGTDPIDLPHCLGTFEVDQTAIGQTTFTIGRDWVEPEGEDNPNDWNTKLENAFGAPSENADIRIVVRAYYTRATRDGNGYAFSEGEGDGDGISTWVMELNSDRQVVGVTYVNPLGMTSDRPFEGMNIIVTRYSDGSCRTSKVMF